MKRRDMLRVLGATTLAGCTSRIPRSNKGALPPPPRSASPSPAPEASDNDHHDALFAAIAAAGGLDFVSPGDTVLLKVNTNSGDPYPYSTSPDVVRWLGHHLKRERRADVIVGDRSFWGDGDTLGNFAQNGIAEAANQVGARLVSFEPDAVAWQELSASELPHWTAPIRIPQLVADVHHVINLPCVKTHFITGVTLSMKNLLGIVHPEDRARPGNLRSHHPEHIYHQIAEVHRAVRPSFNVLDGFRALTSGGPTPGSGADPVVKTLGRILVDHDRRVVDQAGIALLKMHAARHEAVHDFDAHDHPMIRAAS